MRILLLVLVTGNLHGMWSSLWHKLMEPEYQRSRSVSQEELLQREVAQTCGAIEQQLQALELHQSSVAQQKILSSFESGWELVDHPNDWHVFLPYHDRSPADQVVLPEHSVVWYLATQRACQQYQAASVIQVEQAVHRLRERLIFIGQRYDERYVPSVYETYRKNFSSVPGGFDWRAAYEYLGFSAMMRHQIAHEQVAQRLVEFKRCDKDESHAFLYRQLTYVFATPDAKQQYDAALSGEAELARRVLRGDPTYVYSALAERIPAYQERLSAIQAVDSPTVRQLLEQSMQEEIEEAEGR